MRRTITALTLTAALLVAGCSSSDDAADEGAPDTPEAAATGEVPGAPVPENPYLADSVWPATHNNEYGQQSSEAPGPTPDDEVRVERTITQGVPVNVLFSPPYDDGSRTVWTTTSNTPELRGVVKFSEETGETIDDFVPVDEGLEPPPNPALLSGNYKVLTNENQMIVGYSTRLEMYGDDFPADPGSDIELVATFDLPDQALCRETDSLVGMVMTFDGRIAFATDQGIVGLAPRAIDEAAADDVVVASLNGDACADESIADEDLEHITNNIAADEDGGIYAVTSEQMLRFSIDGDEVAIDWTAPYRTGDALSAVRIGDAGSGSTPSVMGTGDDEDQLVAITDGQDVMHLVLYWRNEIPEGWEPIGPGRDPRIACEFPVTFGDPDTTNSESEQSVLVHGYSAALTNNRLEDTSVLSTLAEELQRGSAAFLGGDPELAPRGAERIDWDPETNTCDSAWANTEVSMPNTVPTMSAATNLMYGVGLDQDRTDDTWGLIGMDWDTGEQTMFVPGPAASVDGDTCAEDQLAGFPEGASSVFRPYYEDLPKSCDNSFYSSTTVGEHGVIYIGNFGSMARYVPE